MGSVRDCAGSDRGFMISGGVVEKLTLRLCLHLASFGIGVAISGGARVLVVAAMGVRSGEERWGRGKEKAEWDLRLCQKGGIVLGTVFMERWWMRMCGMWMLSWGRRVGYVYEWEK